MRGRNFQLVLAKSQFLAAEQRTAVAHGATVGKVAE
jgi:hypothetical protein